MKLFRLFPSPFGHFDVHGLQLGPLICNFRTRHKYGKILLFLSKRSLVDESGLTAVESLVEKFKSMLRIFEKNIAAVRHCRTKILSQRSDDIFAPDDHGGQYWNTPKLYWLDIRKLCRATTAVIIAIAV